MNSEIPGQSGPWGAAAVAGDVRGQNFFDIDPDFQALLGLYLPDDIREHMWPHWSALGELAGGRLDALADQADKHKPVLHPRDRYGNDAEWIEHHPAYHEMEKIGFGELGLAAMSHRPGVLGWSSKLPPVAKYAFTYLFVQAEFGIMCPISVSDTAAFLLGRYGDDALKSRYLSRMLSQDMDELLRGTQFMTERAAGSDVGRIETQAEFADGEWRLHGDKWFCSHADADVAMLLARPSGAGAGTQGLGLFLMPRELPDGSRNPYRIVRLKDKMGTRDMASGEISLNGAVAFPVGDLSCGLKQMMDQVTLSRLSHGVRAAAMMRRCWNEARAAAGRFAFGGPILSRPLAQRQLAKIRLPAEQALSMFMFTADVLGKSQGGDAEAATLERILTPLIKLRACRDNIRVATGAMEMRGGNGYIEDWVNARLVRDGHVGVLWEGTSNIIALDAIGRAVGKVGAHTVLEANLVNAMREASVESELQAALTTAIRKATGLAERVAGERALEVHSRHAGRVLYDVTTAALFAIEGAKLRAKGEADNRSRWARVVLEQRLSPTDPLSLPDTTVDAQTLLD
jgi:acyl-CoA dehydrogenase